MKVCDLLMRWVVRSFWCAAFHPIRGSSGESLALYLEIGNSGLGHVSVLDRLGDHIGTGGDLLLEEKEAHYTDSPFKF